MVRMKDLHIHSGQQLGATASELRREARGLRFDGAEQHTLSELQTL